MTSGKVVRVPRYFFEDHETRLLPTPDVVRSGARWVDVIAEGYGFEDLVDDALHYASPYGPDAIDDGGKLVRSAKATVRAVDRALGAGAAAQIHRRLLKGLE